MARLVLKAGCSDIQGFLTDSASAIFSAPALSALTLRTESSPHHHPTEGAGNGVPALAF